MAINILLVEDNVELAGSLADYLSEVGFEMDFVYNGKACIELVKANAYDVIIMDIMMPVQDGLTTCRLLRETLYIDTPIIFLTARGTLDDKLEGFKLGGDDYLVKPFAPEELVCRLNALLKRRQPAFQRVQQTLGDLIINHPLRCISRQGHDIALNELQFQLFTLLAQSAPEPVSRQFLESELWPDGLPESDPLRTHIYHLRQLLDKPFNSELIKTVRGRGYRLDIAE